MTMSNFRIVCAIGILCMSSTSFAAEPTGASLAWTSNDPIVLKAVALVIDGKLKDAQTLLASDDSQPAADAARAREEMKDLIVRLRHEYSLDEAGLLAKVKKAIPDVTTADLKKWRDAGELQYRTIDGQVMYFRREPSNLYRFSADAKQRS